MAKFKVNGLSAVNREIEKVMRDIPKEVDNEIKKIATEILSESISRVHVLSGALKGSAFIEKIEGGYTIGFGISYAAYEEFGTGGFVDVPSGYEDYAMTFKASSGRTRDGQAHPFLFPAFLKRRDKITDELEKKINEYLKSI